MVAPRWKKGISLSGNDHDLNRQVLPYTARILSHHLGLPDRASIPARTYIGIVVGKDRSYSQ
jgi:hypothetical protein